VLHSDPERDANSFRLWQPIRRKANNHRLLLNKRARDSLESSSRSVSFGEPCDRQRVCPTQQLPPDAESVHSRRHAFLRTLLRVFAPFGCRSRPLLRRQESGQTRPQKAPFSQRGCRLGPKILLRSASAWRQRVYELSPKGMHPRAKAQPHTLGPVPPTRAPLSSEPDSIRRRDTRAKHPSNCVTSTALKPDAPLLCFAPQSTFIEPPRVGLAHGVDCCEWIVVTVTASYRARSQRSSP
jgi:hypothetical protein